MKENFARGLVGAFLGSLIGGACIIVLDQIGIVASLSGAVLAVCTLLGYLKMAGDISWKGILVSIALILVVPYFANQVSAAIDFMQYVAKSGDSISFANAYAAVPALLSFDGYDYGLYNYTFDSSAYTEGLIKIYVFAAIGAIPTVKSLL